MLITHIAPRYGQSQVAQVAFFDVDRQPKLVESLFAELQVLESHITAEDTDVELACVEILDIGLEETVQ
jgi:hypothetical protein